MGRSAEKVNSTAREPADFIALCEVCRGIILGHAYGEAIWRDNRMHPFRCPSCGLPYNPTDIYCQVGEYLTDEGLLFVGDDAFKKKEDKLKKLAHRVISNIQTPISGICEAMDRAENFIHIITQKIDEHFAYEICRAGTHCPIKGVITSQGDSIYGVWPEEPESCDAKLRLPSCDNPMNFYPDYSLVIVDGILAFKLPFELTANTLLDLARQDESILIETDPVQVARENNVLFSPAWFRLGKREGYIAMGQPF